MDLFEFFVRARKTKRTTISQMAKEMKCSRTHLNEIVLGNRYPSLDMATKIEKYTNGEVPASEILKQSISKKEQIIKNSFDENTEK